MKRTFLLLVIFAGAIAGTLGFAQVNSIPESPCPEVVGYEYYVWPHENGQLCTSVYEMVRSCSGAVVGHLVETRDCVAIGSPIDTCTPGICYVHFPDCNTPMFKANQKEVGPTRASLRRSRTVADSRPKQ